MRNPIHNGHEASSLWPAPSLYLTIQSIRDETENPETIDVVKEIISIQPMLLPMDPLRIRLVSAVVDWVVAVGYMMADQDLAQVRSLLVL